MNNKECIQLVISKTEEYKAAYKTNNYVEVSAINETVLNSLSAVDMIPKNKADNLKNNELTFSLGNNKIGADTLCINVSTALNCPSDILGLCNNCKICYAKSHNKRYFKNTVPKNLINQIIFNKVVTGDITAEDVADNLIKAVKKGTTKKQFKNLLFLRLNVEGDIADNTVLSAVDKVMGIIVDRLSLLCCYSYSHNRFLDFNKADNIVFNTSDFKKDNIKSCQVIYEITAEVRQKILNKEVILCNGDCNNCSYCKNKADKRQILFLAHGGIFKGLSAVDSELLDFINCQKVTDYKRFIEGATSD